MTRVTDKLDQHTPAAVTSTDLHDGRALHVHQLNLGRQSLAFSIRNYGTVLCGQDGGGQAGNGLQGVLEGKAGHQIGSVGLEDAGNLPDAPQDAGPVNRAGRPKVKDQIGPVALNEPGRSQGGVGLADAANHQHHTLSGKGTHGPRANRLQPEQIYQGLRLETGGHDQPGRLWFVSRRQWDLF